MILIRGCQIRIGRCLALRIYPFRSLSRRDSAPLDVLPRGTSIPAQVCPVRPRSSILVDARRGRTRGRVWLNGHSASGSTSSPMRWCSCSGWAGCPSAPPSNRSLRVGSDRFGTAVLAVPGDRVRSSAASGLGIDGPERPSPCRGNPRTNPVCSYPSNYCYLDLLRRVDQTAFLDGAIETDPKGNDPLAWAVTAEMNELKRAAQESGAQANAAARDLAVVNAKLDDLRWELQTLNEQRAAAVAHGVRSTAFLRKIRRRLSPGILGQDVAAGETRCPRGLSVRRGSFERNVS